MGEAVARSPGLQLIHGKFVLDLKPAGVSKGTAIAAFMDEAPFAGRVPLFVGDDVTDEDGFEQVQRMGGLAVKVGPGPTQAAYRCAGVPELAAWLQAAQTESLPA
jgi:trehalose 6-phosphate phosphatase